MLERVGNGILVGGNLRFRRRMAHESRLQIGQQINGHFSIGIPQKNRFLRPLIDRRQIDAGSGQKTRAKTQPLWRVVIPADGKDGDSCLRECTGTT